MSLTDIQLYANNAKSTLALAAGSSDTVLQVQNGHGARFPTITSPGVQFFLVTLESAGIVEVVKVTNRVGDLFTLERGHEGTSPASFPQGAQFQMRVTRDTLSQFARLTDRLADVSTVADIPPVANAVGNSYVCSEMDDQGNPIVALKSATRWKFLTHSSIASSGSVDSSTTTSLTSSSISNLVMAGGRYIVSFTSGALAGQSRLISNVTGGSTVEWSTPVSAAPAAGTNFEIVVSNAYQMSLISGLSDESLINAIIFGS